MTSTMTSDGVRGRSRFVAWGIMTRGTRLSAGALLLLTLTIEFGGTFILRVTTGHGPVASGTLAASLFRAGHGHAGALVLLALVAYSYVDEAQLGESAKRLVRRAMFLAPLLVSAGFFGAGKVAESGADPGRALLIAYAGGVVLAVGLLTLGFGLVRPVGGSLVPATARDAVKGHP
jgi:hypothetical protein